MSTEDDEEQDDPVLLTFRIRLVDEEGEPIEGVTIYVDYAYLSASETTDDDGWAHFEKVTLTKTLGGDVVAKKISTLHDVLAEDVTIEDDDSFSYSVSRDDY